MSSKRDIAVSVRGLSKSYTIAHEHESHSTLAETLLQRARNPFQRATKETFWALKDVSFDIKKGEVVGIVGRNGAGKSTLLKILSRITEPTVGKIDLYGRVGSLLEVGTGFHPELTGRENIFLNGAILGMPHRDIAQQFDAIVDFAEIARFLDTPVKRYSSGMYVRLAFAVAAHLKSDILVVDEVLAVGDTQFQKKCLGKMGAVAHEGRTVLFVSHQMGTVATLCGKGILLNQGAVHLVGSVQEVVSEYLNLGNSTNHYTIESGKLDIAKNQITSIRIESELGSPCSEFPFSGSVCLTIQLSLPVATPGLLLGIALDNASQSRVFTVVKETAELRKMDVGHIYEAKLKIPEKIIAPNRYSFTVAVIEPNSLVHDHVQNVCPIIIVDDGTPLSRFEGIDYGSVIVNAQWN